MFEKLKTLFEEIYYGCKTIGAIEIDQDLFPQDLERLNNYAPKVEPNISNRRKILENANHFFEGRQMVIDAFENRLFPMSDGSHYNRRDAEREYSSDSDDDDDDDNDGGHGPTGSRRLPRNNNLDDSSGSDDLGTPTRNGGPSGSNNSSRQPKMAKTTKQKNSSSKYSSSLVYKYFGENSLTDINNKIQEYIKIRMI